MEILGKRISWQEHKHKENSGGQNMLKPPKTSGSQYKISDSQSKWRLHLNKHFSIPMIPYTGNPSRHYKDIDFKHVDFDYDDTPVFVPFDDFWFYPFNERETLEKVFKYISEKRGNVMVGIFNTDESLNVYHLDLIPRLVKAIGSHEIDMEQFFAHRLVIMTADVHREQWFRKAFHEAGVPLELANRIKVYINGGVCGDSMYGRNILYPEIKKWYAENQFKFTHRFSMGVMSPKPHRTLLLYELRKAGLLDHVIHTYNAPSYSIPNEVEALSDSEAILASYNKFSESQPDRFPELDTNFVNWFKNSIPITVDDDNKEGDSFILYDYPRSLLNCPISIVTETMTESDYLKYHNLETCTMIDYLGFIKYTEKTIRPIQFHRAFMLCGHHGTYEKLKDLGYQTFNDFWDEDGMSHPDLEKRIASLVKNVKTISDMSNESFLSMYTEMQDILDHNQRLCAYNVTLEQNEKTLMGQEIYNYFKRADALIPITDI